MAKREALRAIAREPGWELKIAWVQGSWGSWGSVFSALPFGVLGPNVCVCFCFGLTWFRVFGEADSLTSKEVVSEVMQQYSEWPCSDEPSR